MTLPVLPSPAGLSVVEIDRYATDVEVFADSTDNIQEVNTIRNRWDGFALILKRESRDGIARLETTSRHLETRAGHLISAMRAAGELNSKGGSKVEGSTLADIQLDKFDAAEFVAMAEHVDIVQAVIATSTDASPPTRNKVRTAIREHKQRQSESQAEAELNEMLEERGIERLTNPAEISAMRRRNEVLAMFHGSITDVLDVRDRYGRDELLSYSDDRLWDAMTTDAHEAVEFITSITKGAA